jgi:hypothetical protein
LDHLDDIEADFRVHYRLTPDDILDLSGPQFLALVWRVAAYGGVIASRFQSQEDVERPESIRGADKVVSATPEGLAIGGVSDLFTFGTG